MITYAEVHNKVLAHIGEAPFLPVFDPALGVTVVDITSMTPVPREGYVYNEAAGTFSAPQPDYTPVLNIALEAIGPAAAQAVISGSEATVLFNTDAAGKSVNGVKATITVTVNGTVLDGVSLPSFDHNFRLPVQPVDSLDNPAGPAVFMLAKFVKGTATVEFYPKDNVCYLITEQAVTKRLEPHEMAKLLSPIRIVAV